MSERTAAEIVAHLGLAPHPEGGSYREIFRSPARVTDARGRERAALTVIYFLLQAGEISAWHVLEHDETWHFAEGDALEIAILAPDDTVDVVAVAPAAPFAAIPAHRPFAARVRAGGRYGLVTCCVAPGFEFEDFALLDAAALAEAHPRAAAQIAAFSSRAAKRTRT